MCRFSFCIPPVSKTVILEPIDFESEADAGTDVQMMLTKLNHCRLQCTRSRSLGSDQ